MIVYAPVEREDDEDIIASTAYRLLDTDGKEVATSSTGAFDVEKPHLWSVDDPYLYTLITTLKADDGTLLDEMRTRVGIRKVELLQDGRSLGRQTMPKDGHLSWTTTYKPGKLVAYGYKNGRKVVTEKVETTDDAVTVGMECSKKWLKPDGQDVVVVDLTLCDKKGRVVPDACNLLQLSVDGPAEILGCGNGDPGFKVSERPAIDDKKHFVINAFMGHAQVILRGIDNEEGEVSLTTELEKRKFTVRFPQR